MTIPRELQRSAPRAIELKMAGKFYVAFCFVLALGGLIGGALLQIKSADDEARSQIRATSRATAEGRVTATEPRNGEDNQARMTYQFTVDGTARTGTFRQKQKMAVGDSVTVGYLPSDPSQNWALGHEPNATPSWVPSLMGVSLLASAAVVFFQLKRQKQLLADGRATVAVALKSKRRSGEHGQYYIIEYEYRQMNGSMCKGKLRAGSAVTAGSEFILVYDPDNPKRAGKYPFPLVRVSE